MDYDHCIPQLFVPQCQTYWKQWCGHDTAGELFTHLLGPLNPPDTSWEDHGILKRFSQLEFIDTDIVFD